MDDERKAQRRRAIEAAAYRALAERGYAGASMLAVATAAGASNETLYRWYGSKLGLFGALVAANAREARESLEAAIAARADPIMALAAVAPALLALVLGERAVALNRAAAADETGELGRAIAAQGRETIVPLIAALCEQAMAEGALSAPSARQAAEWFIALVIGDAQIRRVIGAASEPAAAEIEARAASAMAAFARLCGAPLTPSAE